MIEEATLAVSALVGLHLKLLELAARMMTLVPKSLWRAPVAARSP